MPKLMLFPYNPNTITILENTRHLKGYTITAVSSFKEHEKKLEECEKRNDITCNTNYENLLATVDVLLLIDPATPREAERYLEVIKAANNLGKRVVCSRALRDHLKTLNLDYTVELISEENQLEKQYGKDNLLSIHAPIIVSASEGEDCSKLEVQLLLKTFLEKNGYNASFICSNDYGKLFGMHTIPSYAFSNSRSLERKVIDFNHYVYDIYMEEKPDVIVVGIPGGLSRLNNAFTNHFSEIALVISNAVDIDCGLINLYFDTRCSRKMIEKYKQCCSIKYAIPFVEMIYSRQRVLFDIEEEWFDIYHLDENIMNNEKFKVFFESSGVTNIADSEAIDRSFKRILNTLQTNPNTI